MATYIFVNGIPGVGKTSLLKRMSKDTGIGYIAKDDLKEYLGDVLYKDGESVDPYYYGNASVLALFALLEGFKDSQKTMFVENAFWADRAESEIRKHGLEDSKLIQIYVSCDETENKRRFNERIENGTRHAIHPDGLFNKDASFDEIRNKYRPITFSNMKTFQIDVTDLKENEYQDLLAQLMMEVKNEATN